MNQRLIVAAIVAVLSAGCGSSSSPQLPPQLDDTPPPAPVGTWYAGDLHVHDDHSSDGSALRQCCDDRGPGNTGIADQVGFAVAMGLDFLPLTDHRTHDQHYDPAWESSSLLLIRGEEANGGPHATVHGAVDTVVQGANPPGTPDFVNLQQSIWDAHAQGAAWITAHPDDGELEDDGVTPNVKANAVGVDLVETWNRASNVEREIDYAENRWNRGYRFGIAGASDNHFRELWLIAGPGMPTTRVFAAAQTETAIVDGLRAGRTALSADPLAPVLTLEADFQNDGVYEALGGDEIVAPAGTPGRLRLRVRNGAGTTLVVYRSPGRAAAPQLSEELPFPATDAEYLVDVVAEAAPAWYRAELRGFGLPAGLDTGDVPFSLIPQPAELPNQLRATTSPIFVSTAPVEAQAEIAIPPDQGSDDGARRVIGAAGRYAGFADVAVAGGVDHVVAEVQSDGASRVAYARRSAAATASEVVLSGESVAARFPRVAARGNDVWVAWQDETGNQVPRRSAILLRHSGDGGSTWDAVQTVRSVDGRAEHPALALTADGLPVLAWQEIGSGAPFDVWVQVVGRDAEPTNLSGDGKTIAAANPLDTRSARYPASIWPALAVAADGRLAVAWQDNRGDADPLWTGSLLAGEGTDPDNWQILVRTLPSGGSWSGIATLGADDRADRHPALAFAADGTLVALWDTRELRSSGANVALLSAVSGDGGASWSDAQALALDENAMSLWPRLGTGARGVRAVWYDTRSADWRQRIMTATYVEGVWSAATMLPSRGINTWPATAADRIVFSSTRNATRLQRDRTRQIFVAGAP